MVYCGGSNIAQVPVSISFDGQQSASSTTSRLVWFIIVAVQLGESRKYMGWTDNNVGSGRRCCSRVNEQELRNCIHLVQSPIGRWNYQPSQTWAAPHVFGGGSDFFFLL